MVLLQVLVSGAIREVAGYIYKNMPYKNTHTNPNTTFIYVLQSGDDIKYIGKADNPRARMSQHKATSGFKNPHLHRWMNKKGDVVLNVIDEIPKDSWEFWEKWYIQLFKSWGFKLANLTEGGDGVIAGTYDKELAEQKRRASRIYKRGKEHPMYGIKGKDHPHFGHKHTEETIGKIREANTGKKNHRFGTVCIHSEDTIKKCSEAKKEQWKNGVYNSQEYRNKISASNKGKIAVNKKAIKCNETGEVFESIEAAALKLLGNKKGGGNICSQLNGKLKTAYKHTFSYV